MIITTLFLTISWLFLPLRQFFSCPSAPAATTFGTPVFRHTIVMVRPFNWVIIGVVLYPYLVFNWAFTLCLFHGCYFLILISRPSSLQIYSMVSSSMVPLASSSKFHPVITSTTSFDPSSQMSRSRRVSNSFKTGRHASFRVS